MARNKTRETKIRKMIDMGLSISQIAGALHIKKAVVAGILAEMGKPTAGGNAGTISRESEKNVQSSKTTKIKKEVGKAGGDGDPSQNKNIGEMPADPGNAPEGPGKPEGSTGDPGSTGIKFIGGKKNMAKKKEGDPDPEEKEYECPHCHHEFNEKSDTCPSCGKTLSGYDD